MKIITFLVATCVMLSSLSGCRRLGGSASSSELKVSVSLNENGNLVFETYIPANLSATTREELEIAQLDSYWRRTKKIKIGLSQTVQVEATVLKNNPADLVIAVETDVNFILTVRSRDHEIEESQTLTPGRHRLVFPFRTADVQDQQSPSESTGEDGP